MELLNILFYLSLAILSFLVLAFLVVYILIGLRIIFRKDGFGLFEKIFSEVLGILILPIIVRIFVFCVECLMKTI